MQINEIYDAVLYRLNKDKVGRSYTVSDFNLHLKLANTDLFKVRYGLPEMYRPGLPIPPQAWSVSQKIEDDLRNCKVTMGNQSPPLYVNKYGLADLPSDYVHQSTLYTDYGDIEVLDDDSWSGRLRASLRKPTAENAICRFLNGQIEFAPKNLSAVNFTYLRMPNTPFMDYDIVNDVEVYLDENSVHANDTVLSSGDASRTVQLEWSRQVHTDFINLMVGYASEHLREQMIKQTSEGRKNKGV